MRQRAVLLREHSQRRVVAHGTDRLLAVLHHGVQHHLEVFHRDGCCQLTPAQFRTVLQHQWFGSRSDDGIEFHDILRPVLEFLRGGQFVLDRAVVVELAPLQVDADHLSRPYASLLCDAGLRQDDHARFGSDEQQAVPGDRVSERSQAISIKASHDPAAVSDRQRSRSVPWLHDGIGILVHRTVRLRH